MRTNGPQCSQYCRELKVLPLPPFQPHKTVMHSLPPQTPSLVMFVIAVLKDRYITQKTKGGVWNSHACFCVHDCAHLSHYVELLKGKLRKDVSFAYYIQKVTHWTHLKRITGMSWNKINS